MEPSIVTALPSQLTNGSPPSSLSRALGTEIVVDKGLIQVQVNPENLDLVALYEPVLGKPAMNELFSLARSLVGVRVAHINATSFGGGVAELLNRQIPLMNQLGQPVGFQTDWFILTVDDALFYEVTKKSHNALQGSPGELSQAEKVLYCRTLLANYNQGKLLDYDVVIIHDPQPIGLIEMHPNRKNRWAWRCHIDTTEPNMSFWRLVSYFARQYDSVIWTRPSFVQDMPLMKTVRIIPPSIDPLSAKNRPMEPLEVEAVFAAYGIEQRRPVMLQVSRFDPWKRPLEVIRIYQELKHEFPGLQLILAGSMATDDPEGMLYWEKSLRRAGEDEDVFIFNNYHGVGSHEINAFQRGADVVLQYSSKEGFGLTVSEAMWKDQPVIGGDVGGIQDQIISGENGFRVSNAEEAKDAARVLLRDSEKRKTMGLAAHLQVEKHFLINREVADYLRLIRDLSGRS
jgi:trehalose synthase